MQRTVETAPRLGSARAETRADGPGPHMELIPGYFYDKTGVGADTVRLGSARAATRAVEDGTRAELIPERFWDVAGVRLD